MTTLTHKQKIQLAVAISLLTGVGVMAYQEFVSSRQPGRAVTSLPFDGQPSTQGTVPPPVQIDAPTIPAVSPAITTTAVFPPAPVAEPTQPSVPPAEAAVPLERDVVAEERRRTQLAEELAKQAQAYNDYAKNMAEAGTYAAVLKPRSAIPASEEPPVAPSVKRRNDVPTPTYQARSVIQTPSYTSAVLHDGEGKRYPVQVGSALPGGFRVAEIHAGTVTLVSRDGTRERLTVQPHLHQPAAPIALPNSVASLGSALPMGVPMSVPSEPIPYALPAAATPQPMIAAPVQPQ